MPAEQHADLLTAIARWGNSLGQDTELQGWSLGDRDPDTLRALMPFYGWCYKHYFRVETSGWHHIDPNRQYLFVGSHNGGLAAPDMHMFIYDWVQRFGADRPVYGLMHPLVWRVYGELAKIATRCGAVRAHPKMAIAALEAGAHVLVYPGGAEDTFRPYAQRDRICFAERRGFIKLALRQGVPIVPAISWGAHDTLIVLADIYDQLETLPVWQWPGLKMINPHVFPIYLGLPWGLAIGPLPNVPLPAKIWTRVCAPIEFERTGRKAAGDRDYVEECYWQVQTQMQAELDQLIADAADSAHAPRR